MADTLTLRETLIEAIAQRRYPGGELLNPDVRAVAMRNATKDVDVVLATLAEEEPDDAMIYAGANACFDPDEALELEEDDVWVQKEIWKAQTAALRDSGRTENNG